MGRLRAFVALVWKELLWNRRRIALLLFVFVVLPGATASASLLFQDVLPRDAPVAVVPDGGVEAVGESNLDVATKTVGLFAHPVGYDSQSAAFAALDSETVYGVVVVPPDIDDPAAEPTVHVHVDGAMVPYREPSQAVVSLLRRSFDRAFEPDVGVQWHARGTQRGLGAYLVPTLLMAFVATIALAYLPYALVADGRATDRLRAEGALGTSVAARIAVLTLLLALPLVVFQGASAALDYDIALLAPGTLAGSVLAFLALAGIGTAITYLSGLSTAGRLANLVVLFGVLGFSGLAYPAGFFSATRRVIIRRMPTHYAMVLVRNGALTDSAPYPTWVAGLAGFAATTLLAAALAVWHYDRRASP